MICFSNEHRERHTDTDEVEQDKKNQRIELDILRQLKGWTKKRSNLPWTDRQTNRGVGGGGVQKEQRKGGTETDGRKKQTGG